MFKFGDQVEVIECCEAATFEGSFGVIMKSRRNGPFTEYLVRSEKEEEYWCEGVVVPQARATPPTKKDTLFDAWEHAKKDAAKYSLEEAEREVRSCAFRLRREIDTLLTVLTDVERPHGTEAENVLGEAAKLAQAVAILAGWRAVRYHLK